MEDLRAVQFAKREYDEHVCRDTTVIVKGKFHQWGADADENGQYTIAIIETPNGKIHTPLAHEVTFTDKKYVEGTIHAAMDADAAMKKACEKACLTGD